MRPRASGCRRAECEKGTTSTEEPELSRPRHRAPDTATRGPSGPAARHALRGQNRSRILLALSLGCASLLVAAPVALVVSGGPEGSDSRAGGVYRGAHDSPGSAPRAGRTPALHTEAAPTTVAGLPPVTPAPAPDAAVGARAAAADGAAPADRAAAAPTPAGARPRTAGTAAGAVAPGGSAPGTGGAAGKSARQGGSGGSTGATGSSGGSRNGAGNGSGDSAGGGSGGGCGCPDPVGTVTDGIGSIVDDATGAAGGVVGGVTGRLGAEPTRRPVGTPG